MNKESLIYSIDFDGTIAKNTFPDIKEEVPYAFDCMKQLLKEGHKLILFTMRSGVYLDEAVEYCKVRGVEFWGININPEQYIWTTSPKVYAHFYIDDAMLGMPLIYPKKGLPYVDWATLKKYFSNKTTQHLVLTKEESLTK